MLQERSGSPTSLANMLEARRLAVRARRVERVIEALRERETARDRDAAVPRPLQHAIVDFGRELGTINDRIRTLEQTS